MRRGSEEMDVKPDKADTCVEATPSITIKERERNRVSVPCEGPAVKAKKRTEKEETNVKTEKRGTRQKTGTQSEHSFHNQTFNLTFWTQTLPVEVSQSWICKRKLYCFFFRLFFCLTADFFSRYILGRLLGKGGCGAVHAGVRKSDGKKVAVKFMRKPGIDTYITLPGDTRRLPLEVALMKLVCEPPYCPLVIELVEWHETSTHVILVLERPEPCTDLFDYCENETMSESMARIITRQVIHAARHCSDRGVFHRDIKAENILLNPRTLEIKLIDFGCGDLLKNTPYTEYAGTTTFCPPEWIVKGEYEAEPATVWGLGVFLYQLLCGEELFSEAKDVVNGHVDFPDHLSEASCSLIKLCLQRDPKRRPTLKQILSHQWFCVQEAREKQ
ncbi:serine/threonine-protein kinase pim-2-like [Clarias gariepinus]|uniref:serine/threonine-protein kinase pim-2-like n=1 Tax=Clarias gariepinus TaxID=13013 RepID=UPI00234DC500|nr:serine/threonine-protein kinase pim-2-like [Clarias gariepinus]